MISRRVGVWSHAVLVLPFVLVSVTWSPGGEPTRATTATKEASVAPVKEPPSLAKGIQAYKAGKLDEAIAAFEQAVKEEPRHAFSHQYLARTYYEKKRFADAVKMARETAALDPKSARNWRTLGLALMATGDLKAAVEAFAKSAEIEPKNYWTQNDLGYALFLLGRNEEACKALERAVQADGTKAMTWNTLGVARLRSGDRAGAIEAFKKALQVDPKYVNAKAGLAAAESQPAPKPR
jgi:superkiller protein 3